MSEEVISPDTIVTTTTTISNTPATPIIKPSSNEIIETLNEEKKKNFAKEVLHNIVDAILSVKVWGLFTYLFISTTLCFNGHLSGQLWATANVSVFSLIFGMNYVFARAKLGKLDMDADVTYVSEKDYWLTVWYKFIDNITDIKVIGLAAYTIIATIFAMKHINGQPIVSGDVWTQATGAIYTLIFGMREQFKLEQIEVLPPEEIAKIKI